MPFFCSTEGSDSPYINHFLSADTIVPGYTNPQSLNRYSYVVNNPLKYTDPTGHVLDGGSGGAGSACSDKKCKDDVWSRKLKPCKKCDVHNRHETVTNSYNVTGSIATSAVVNVQEYYGDYDNNTNVPYVPGVSSGINGPMMVNPCVNGPAQVACVISLIVSLLPSSPQQNSNSNFSLTFNVEETHSLNFETVEVSNLQYANRGESSVLSNISINGNDVLPEPISFMEVDGSYQPTGASGGVYHGTDPLEVSSSIFVSIPSTPNGAGGIWYEMDITVVP